MCDSIQGGAHLGVVRNWIKCHFCFGNGETVTWGSDEVLRGRDVRVKDLERLAQDIRDAVLKEYKVEPKEHKCKFVIFSNKGPAFQDVDTSREAWNAMFNISDSNFVDIIRKDGDKLSEVIVSGTSEEVSRWLLQNELK